MGDVFRYRIAEPGGPDIETYHRLRTQMYLEEDLIDSADLDPVTGVHVDQYDEHSTHLLVSVGDGVDIGCWRIVEQREGCTLPVQDLYGIDVLPRSYESSGSAILPAYRKTLAGLGFFRAMLAIADERGLDHAYGIVEQPYLTATQAFGIPIQVLSEPRFVFNADNVAIMVDRDELMAALHGADVPSLSRFITFFREPFDWTLDEHDLQPSV